MSDGRIVLRPSVRWFAEMMELKLRANDHKGGWEWCSYRYLLVRLNNELGELRRVIARRRNKTPPTAFEVNCEAADVANFAMMIALNYKDEHVDPEPKR